MTSRLQINLNSNNKIFNFVYFSKFLSALTKQMVYGVRKRNFGKRGLQRVHLAGFIGKETRLSRKGVELQCKSSREKGSWYFK